MTGGASETDLWPRSLTVREAGAHGRRALSEAGLADPWLESAILLGHVLCLDPAGLLIHAADLLHYFYITEFRALIARRLRREPSAYITGTKQWLDMTVAVNRNVLIPRPESETLVGLTIAEAANLSARLGRPLSIIDVGTGSGAIACAVARACATARVTATDCEGGALRTARRNAERLAGGRIEFMQCDLLPPEASADLIVANLPYIPTAELAGLAPELGYEPRPALDGGMDGLAAIHALLKRLASAPRSGSFTWLECHHDQAVRIAASAQALIRDCRASIHPDLAGIDRFVRVEVR
jgi:release factor glutamine methyltransferase